MQLPVGASNNAFNELNEYVLKIRNMISASAASTYIIQDGCVANEWYAGYHDKTIGSRETDVQSRFNIASIRKTFLGFAVSVALYEGRIESLDEYVTNYLEDLDELLLKDTKIRHLLTHTHGLQGSDYPLIRIFPLGTGWKYDNTGVNLLIKIVNKVFAQTLAEVIEERLFKPYGFTESGWVQEKSDKLVWLDEIYKDNQGNDANLFISTRELAYWGYIHLTKGKVRGTQIIPSTIFEQVSSIVSTIELSETLPRNGYFWWVQDKPQSYSELGHQLPKNAYQSLGLYGNTVLVIPEYKVVAVRMLNQVECNPPEYDYIKDIQTFGNLVCKCMSNNSKH
ncbi:serine hydrolase domain-containing protein [Paenibacillus alba]|uniref:Serine hydrolase n=1 Tax=Paenibacillus alba TaxID=1197127 RepID=A0ABU6G8P8_9BACL|nr:serine hydrolase domain-containing protein [Paenibacillus alba]MEC0229990.1 serine hydrolase [Paenibacillus alba]